jgi:hypothetical protein
VILCSAGGSRGPGPFSCALNWKAQDARSTNNENVDVKAGAKRERK